MRGEWSGLRDVRGRGFAITFKAVFSKFPIADIRLSGKLVPDAPDRQDVDGVVGIGLELLA